MHAPIRCPGGSVDKGPVPVEVFSGPDVQRSPLCGHDIQHGIFSDQVVIAPRFVPVQVLTIRYPLQLTLAGLESQNVADLLFRKDLAGRGLLEIESWPPRIPACAVDHGTD